MSFGDSSGTSDSVIANTVAKVTQKEGQNEPQTKINATLKFITKKKKKG